jgi:hypothetical protein
MDAKSQRGSGRDPSPDPRRLVRTPDAGHPLPKGEGKPTPFFSSWKGRGTSTPSPFKGLKLLGGNLLPAAPLKQFARKEVYELQ